MSSGTAAPFAPTQPEPLSQIGRVVNTFIAPSKTFADIRRSASWWLPWLLVSFASLAFMYTIDKKIGFEQVMQTEISRSARNQAQMEQLTPEQRQRAIDMQVKIGRYAGYAGPIFALLYLVIIAAVLLAAFNFGAGAELKFSASLAIVAYSALPGLVNAFVGIVSVLAGINPEGFNIRNPVASNVAYFLDPTQNKFLYGMASALDIFVIWTIVLLAMGFTANGKVKRGTAFAIIIGLYLVYKVAVSALGTLG
jgi:hypothetical protein